MKDKVVIITGGSSGIGKALASHFGQKGSKILITGRIKEELDAAVAELSNKGIEIIGFQGDVSIRTDNDKMAALAMNKFGQIDVLINNAGIELNYDLDDHSEVFEKIQEEVNVNFISPMILIAGFIPLLKKHHESAIINVSSGLIYGHKKNAVVYSATKSAIHGASISLREQLKETSIKVFEIVPPLTDTPLTKNNPHKKTSPQNVVEEFLEKFENDKLEINIGIVKYLKLMHSFFPKLTKKIINKRNSKT